MVAPKESPPPKYRPEGLGSRNPLTGDMSPVTDAQLATIKAIEDKYGISMSATSSRRLKDGSSLEFINTKGKPKLRPKDLMSNELRTVPNFLESQYKVNGEKVKLDLAKTANPVSMLGLITGNTFKLISENYTTLDGVYFPGSIKQEGGDWNSETARSMAKRFREQDPAQIDDIAFSGLKGPLKPLTPVHEVIHRGLNQLRTAFPYDKVLETEGEDVARVLYDESVEHVLIEAILQSRGHQETDKYRYRDSIGLTDSSLQKVYRSITPIFKLSNSLLEENGYNSEQVMAELAEEEAGRMKSYGKDVGQASLWDKFKTKLGFATGGLATEEAPRSNSMKDQMKMFAEGGIRDDGMDVDPVSGNDVPSGSLASEVRDDIPAQLSEGEYVVPADVVRYFGVRVFEEMRMEAKQGLQMMEANGRIGGEPIEPPMQEQDEQGVTDADMASLEDMMRTGVANGGLMDKIAYTAMNDPMVNSKLNQGGMAIGYAPGGMVASPYNDPTKIDQVIGQFMEMTKKNPAIMDELAKRGISINRTSATEKPDQMAQGNAPVETTNPITNQTPVMAAEGALVNTGFNSLSEDQQKNYVTSPTTMSSMFGIPGGSYFYQGPGVPNKPVEEQNQCPPGQTFDEEKQMCVVTTVAAEPVEPVTNTIDQNDKENPIYDPKKEWRYTSTQTDWSSSFAVDAYLNSITEVKPEGFLDKALKASPIGAALSLAEKENIKMAGYKLDAEKFIAEEIIGGAVGIKNTKVIDAHKTKWAKTLTKDMQEKVNTINQAAIAQNIINTVRELVPDAYKNVDFTGKNNTPTIADLQNNMTNQIREALISSNRGGIITAAVEAGQNRAMGAMAQKRADASFQRTESARDDAQDTIADKEDISKDTRTVEGKETLASKAKRGGGFNKGGLMKKRKNK